MKWILRHHHVSSVARSRAGLQASPEALLGCALAMALILLVVGPIPQSQAYHHFHDGRTLLGVPNGLNTLSNIAFVLVGAVGLCWLRTAPHGLPGALRRAYSAVMVGTLLTGFGSGWYHVAPSHASLVWDRLPMVIAFAGLLSAVVGERVSLQVANRLLAPSLLFGVASVFHWQVYDDLRAYVFAQFFPMLAIPVMLWSFAGRYTRSGDLVAVLAIYAAAKAFEAADGFVFQFGHVVSGHTLKHLAAASAAAFLVRMLMKRREIA